MRYIRYTYVQRNSIIITIWLRSRIFCKNWISYHETLIILLISFIHKINHYDLIWIFIWDHFKCYRWLPWLCDNIWFISNVFLLLLLNTFPILISLFLATIIIYLRRKSDLLISWENSCINLLLSSQKVRLIIKIWTYSSRS